MKITAKMIRCVRESGRISLRKASEDSLKMTQCLRDPWKRYQRKTKESKNSSKKPERRALEGTRGERDALRKECPSQ
jgi:hypothetical protein